MSDKIIITGLTILWALLYCKVVYLKGRLARARELVALLRALAKKHEAVIAEALPYVGTCAILAKKAGLEKEEVAAKTAVSHMGTALGMADKTEMEV